MSEKHDQCRLSIIIPTKDRPLLLAAAVRSILAAAPKEGTEVIVVDDRSASPVAESLETSDSRLRVLASQAEPGASGARNWGVSQAHGDYILFLDDDDLMLPGYPEWVAQQDADYGCSDFLKLSGLEYPESFPVFPGGKGKALKEADDFRHTIAGLGCGFWVKRSVFLDVGGISEDLRVNEDTEFSIRLLKAGYYGIRAPSSGVMVRDHGGSNGERAHLTHSTGAAERAKYFGVILSRHSDWLVTQPDATKFLLRRQIKLLAKARDAQSAREVLTSAAAKPYRFSLFLYYHAEKVANILKSKRG